MKYEKIEVGNAILYYGKCEDVLPILKNESVDSIITDPPYLYLKHKLDIAFNENVIFDNWYRVLKENRLIAFFGRGDPFFRWNLMLDKLGFKFKEHAIWDKNASSNFLCNFARIHEDISIRVKGKLSINKCFIDYFDYSITKNRIDNIENIFKRLKSAINGKDKESVKKYIDSGVMAFNIIVKPKHELNARTSVKRNNRSVGVFKTVKDGRIETSILRCKKEQLNYQHPTQKPIELMTRLIKLITKKNDIVLDPFMGGGSTGIAAIQNGRKFIGIECNREYFDIAVKRMKEAYNEKQKTSVQEAA